MSKIFLRKTWRLCGIIFPLAYYFGSKTIALIVVLLFLGTFVLIELLRFTIPALNKRLISTFGFLFKETEKKRLFTTTTFLISFLITILLFQKDIAITAMLFSIFGDAASAIVGVHGKKRIFDKSIEGSLAFLVICLAIGLALSLTKIHLVPAVFILGAFSAALIELLPLRVDDNLTIALVAGAVMSAISKFL
jgi:dolichol kinase